MKCIAAPNSTPTAGPYIPKTGDKIIIPIIIPMLYTIGARAGIKKYL